MAMARGDRSRSPGERPATSNASPAQINKLVREREKARQAGDYEAADGLRERLSSVGVTLFDKTNSWRSADGRSGRIPTWSELEGVDGGMLEEDAMVSSGEARELTPEEEHIRNLVQQREQARAAKDFGRSDQIRDELKAMGVDLFDKEKMWRKKDGLAGVIIGYSGTGPTDLEVSTLIVQREKARQSSDYSTADVIRDELKRYGIDIDDKGKVWRSSSDGRSGPVPSWAAIMGGDAPGSGGGGGGAPAGYAGAAPHSYAGGYGGQQDLSAQIMSAAHAAQSVNPIAAAQVLQVLQSLAHSSGIGGGGGGGGGRAYHNPPPPAHSSRGGGHYAPPSPGQARAYVQHDSQAGAPRSGGGGRGQRSPEVDEALEFCRQLQSAGRRATDSEIHWLVETREKARQNKDYPSSDGLRDALRSALGLELFEKEKRWSASDGREGPIPLWSNLG